jgi:hypothetical protein
MASKHKKELQKNKKKEIVELKKTGKWEVVKQPKPVKKIKQAGFIQQLQNRANQQLATAKNQQTKLPIGRWFAQILAIIFIISLVLAGITPLFR